MAHAQPLFFSNKCVGNWSHPWRPGSFGPRLHWAATVRFCWLHHPDKEVSNFLLSDDRSNHDPKALVKLNCMVSKALLYTCKYVCHIKCKSTSSSSFLIFLKIFVAIHCGRLIMWVFPPSFCDSSDIPHTGHKALVPPACCPSYIHWYTCTWGGWT